jgi:hypothetical protein
MWRYYKQSYPGGDWTLFREGENREEEIFNWKLGWMSTQELGLRRMRGDVDSSDEISDAEAQALVASVAAGSGASGPAPP